MRIYQITRAPRVDMGLLGYNFYAAAVVFNPLAICLAEAHPNTVLSLAYHLNENYTGYMLPYAPGIVGAIAKPLVIFVRNNAWQRASIMQVLDIPGCSRPLLRVDFNAGQRIVRLGFVHTSHDNHQEGVGLQSIAILHSYPLAPIGDAYLTGDFNIHLEDAKIRGALIGALNNTYALVLP